MCKKPLLMMLLLALFAPWAANAQTLNEGFEGTTFPPEDWTAIHISGDQQWTRSTGIGANGSSAFAYRKDVSGGYEDYLITPLLVPASGEELSFYLASQYAVNYANTTLSIEVSTTTPTVDAFTDVLATYTSGSDGDFGTTGSSNWVNKTVDVSAYVGQQIYIAFHATDIGYNADVRIDDVSGVSLFVLACDKPRNVTVTNITAYTAELSWTSDATAWNIAYTPTGGAQQVVTVYENPYTLTGLTPNTEYEVGVQRFCDDGGYSILSNRVYFTTDHCMPEDKCAITIELTDAYGDGGGQIQVVDALTNEVLGTFTNSSNSSTYTLAVCEGREINFVYTPTDNWSYENGWVITDINEVVISEHVGCSSSSSCDAPNSGLIATYTVNCTVTDCRTPSDLAILEVGPRSAKLSWTENGQATEWTVEVTLLNTPAPVEPMMWSTTSNPFEITGLQPESTYSVRVLPLCDVELWSDEITFTTDVACPNPKNFDVNEITHNSALISWLTYANEVELQYALVNPTATPAKANRGSWLYYDNGTNEEALGLGGGSFYWGIMFPAGSYSGNSVTKVSLYDYMAMNGTVTIYNDGDTAPADSVGSMSITWTGTGAFEEFEFNDPVLIDPSKNLWIVIYNASGATYPAAYSTVSPADPNGRWISIDGETWEDVNDEGFDATWMIRAFVDVYIPNPDELEWISLGNQTSPYRLTGLDPETLYSVRVKALCGEEDGESEWVYTTFTTLSPCEIPFNLTVYDRYLDGATLSWEGVQNSYNVRYRTAASIETFFFENFENGMPSDWTIVDSDGDGNNWQISTDVSTSFSCHSGEKCMTSASYINNVGAVEPDNWLITPQLNLQGTMEVWMRGQDPSYASENVAIYLSTTGNAIEDFTITLMDTTVVTGEYMAYTADLSDYAGQQGYIAIRHFNCTDMYYLNVDDFGLFGDIIEAGEWIPVDNITATTTQLTGLILENEYEWQVQGKNRSCNNSEGENGVTEWSEISTFVSDDGVVFVNDGDWNNADNWYRGEVPAAGANVIISANAIIPADYDAVVNEIEIHVVDSLPIGSITIQDGGQLHANVAVEATVEKNITGYGAGEGKWNLISAPFRDYYSTSEVANLLDGDYDFYRYSSQEEGQEWQNHKTDTISEMANGVGYLYAKATDETLGFTGLVSAQLNSGYFAYLNNSTYLSYDSINTEINWHLVGNNYPHNGYVYLAEYYDNGWHLYNTDHYKLNDDGTELILSDEMVKPGEGIFVLSTDYDQVAIITSVSYRSRAEGAINVDVVNNNGNRLVDRAALRFREGRNVGKLMINPKHTNISMTVGEKDYAVVYNKEGRDKMPVNFKAEKNGVYTLNFSIENMEFSYLHLVDLLTGAEVDLLANPQYTFKAMAGENASRFVIDYEVMK